MPVWIASDHAEFAARTIRPKIHKLLPQFLTEFPKVKKQDEQLVAEWWKEVEKVDGEVEWQEKKVNWKKWSNR